MKRIYIRLNDNCYLDDEIVNYLLSVNGITDIILDRDDNGINILYDDSKISILIIKKEVELFLDIIDISSIISFNKYLDCKLDEYEINIMDLCCEYCLYGYVGELLLIDGINSANCYYDGINKKNVKIRVSFDSKIIDKNKICMIENNFN